MEYGASSAVARWTAQGKDISYVLVTRGEAGIESLPPDEAAAIRVAEQRASCAVVGVEMVEFLDHPDGLVQETLSLRRDIANAIRRHRPDVIVSVNHRDSWGGPSWNHADHRAVGRALLDATRDAANQWIHPRDGDAWDGVRFVAFSSSPHATHAVDITDYLDAGIASLTCHRTYLANLATTTDPDTFLRSQAVADGPRLAVTLATTFELTSA